MNSIKSILIVCLLAIAPAIISAQNANTETEIQQQQTTTDTLTFTVYGMDCPGCQGGLEKQVNKLPWVQYSKANWVKQELKLVVKPDGEFSIDELNKRVKKANFTLVTPSEKKKKDE